VHKYIIKDTVEEQVFNIHARRLEAAGGIERVLSLANGKKRGVQHGSDHMELTKEDIIKIFNERKAEE
jgi:hypothetical protein